MSNPSTNAAEEQQTSALAGLGRLVELDPRELELDPRNARTENPKPDAALLASVARIGVQEPITVRPMGEGRYGVIKGQRRWLAALEAAKKVAAKGKQVRPVPAFVRDDLDGADAEALLLSIVENTQRAGMTARDTVNGAAQLELLSTNETDRRRAAAILGLKRDQLKSAKKAAELSPEGLQDGARYRFDLMELADLAEVEDVPSAAADLARAKRRDQEEGKNRQGHWQHAMARLRQDQAERRKRAAAEEALTEAGVKLLPRYRQMDSAERPLTDLTTGLNKPITSEAHAAGCGGHAARLDEECQPVYFCTDPGKFAHKVKGERDAAEAQEAERAKRRKVIENNKAARAAREARKDFVTELCGRKTVSEAAWHLVLSTILNNPDLYTRFINKTGKNATADVARFTRAADPEGKAEPFADLIQRTGKAKRPQLLLAHIAAAYEAEMHDKAWQSPSGDPHQWLTFLAAEGYTLSDHEAEMIADAERRAAAADSQGAAKDEEQTEQEQEEAQQSAAQPEERAEEEPQVEEAGTDPQEAVQEPEEVPVPGEPEAEEAADAQEESAQQE